MYDVIISGAGLAGSTAAKIIAEAGLKVIMFEKNKLPWRKPCGGGVPHMCIKEFKLSKKYAEGIINGFSLRSSTGKELTINYKDHTNEPNYFDYVVDRKTFDQHIRERALDAGAIIETETTVNKVLIKNGNVSGVKVRDKNGKLKEIRSKIVIAADGVGSKIVIDAGLRKQWKKSDYAICSAAIVKGYIENSKLDQLIFSNKFAPDCYAWIFPMSDGKANIGIGMWGSKKENPINYLEKFMAQDFIKQKFYKPKIIWKLSYPVPLAGIKGKTYGSGILSVGDASGFVLPMIGAGIHYAFITGKFAGETAVIAIEDDDYSKKSLKRYQDKWKQRNIKKSFANQILIRDLLISDLDKFSNLLIKWALENSENKELFAKMFLTGLEISDDLFNKFSDKLDIINLNKK
ncbi:MAG: NAD(P)/FAD-dependent oxidoreductase [Candidatus Helarchaeota archaeon]